MKHFAVASFYTNSFDCNHTIIAEINSGIDIDSGHELIIESSLLLQGREKGTAIKTLGRLKNFKDWGNPEGKFT